MRSLGKSCKNRDGRLCLDRLLVAKGNEASIVLERYERRPGLQAHAGESLGCHSVIFQGAPAGACVGVAWGRSDRAQLLSSRPSRDV